MQYLTPFTEATKQCSRSNIKVSRHGSTQEQTPRNFSSMKTSEFGCVSGGVPIAAFSPLALTSTAEKSEHSIQEYESANVIFSAAAKRSTLKL
jgi:hypothetical protein